MSVRLIALAPVAAILALAVTLVAPQGAGLGGTWPWVPVLAFRGIVAAAALAAAVVLTLLAVTASILRWPMVRSGLAALAAVAVLVAAGEVTVLAVRGLHDAPPATAPPTGALTVLETNTDHSQVAPAVLVHLALTADADVVTMPETTTALAEDVADRLTRDGRGFQVFSVPGQGAILPTSLLVSDALGRYRQVNSTGLKAGIVIAEPVPTGVPSRGRPTLIAAHPQAPVSAGDLPAWRGGIGEAVARCAAAPDAVLAGDFNATLDHPPLHASVACADAADQAGSAGISTWPQRLPRGTGAPLDHVFSSRAHWRTSATWTMPLPGSDHRALVARLAPVGGEG